MKCSADPITADSSNKHRELDLAVFKAVWEGKQSHEYGEIAVTETMGIALYTMRACDSYDEAMLKAKELWANRKAKI